MVYYINNKMIFWLRRTITSKHVGKKMIKFKTYYLKLRKKCTKKNLKNVYKILKTKIESDDFFRYKIFFNIYSILLRVVCSRYGLCVSGLGLGETDGTAIMELKNYYEDHEKGELGFKPVAKTEKNVPFDYVSFKNETVTGFKELKWINNYNLSTYNTSELAFLKLYYPHISDIQIGYDSDSSYYNYETIREIKENLAFVNNGNASEILINNLCNTEYFKFNFLRYKGSFCKEFVRNNLEESTLNINKQLGKYKCEKSIIYWMKSNTFNNLYKQI